MAAISIKISSIEDYNLRLAAMAADKAGNNDGEIQRSENNKAVGARHSSMVTAVGSGLGTLGTASFRLNSFSIAGRAGGPLAAAFETVASGYKNIGAYVEGRKTALQALANTAEDVVLAGGSAAIGAEIGGSVGSFVPVVGNLVGVAVGAGIGYGLDKLGHYVVDTE